VDTKDTDDRNLSSAGRAAAKLTRRRYSIAQKREIVEVTLEDGQSVSVVARHYDVNANQLFRWRKQYREGLLGEVADIRLLPVEVSETQKAGVADSPEKSLAVTADGSLEVLFSNQHRLRISGQVCQRSLATILRVLS
jgi:transposase